MQKVESIFTGLKHITKATFHNIGRRHIGRYQTISKIKTTISA